MGDPRGDRLAGLVGQLELYRLLGLVLEDDGAVRDGAAVGDSRTRSATRSQPRSLLSMARLNRARSRSRSRSCRRIRMAQISRTFSGGFGPVSLPLFQGVRD